jgi:hypothetical protein
MRANIHMYLETFHGRRNNDNIFLQLPLYKRNSSQIPNATTRSQFIHIHIQEQYDHCLH